MLAISFDTSSSTFRPSQSQSPSQDHNRHPRGLSTDITTSSDIGRVARMESAMSVQPFNTGGVNSPGAPPGPGTEYASISLDTEMMDDDEIMAMGQTTGYDGTALETPVDGGAVPQNSPEDLVPNKVHLRGLDSMSSADVKAFVMAYYPAPEMDKLEWIDDTSLNIVYQDAETALAALAALTTPINAGARPWELREAKTHDAYPLARLDVRLAFVTDRKEKGARERSRYYLFHPEEDRVEQQEKKRRDQERERRERRRDASDYRQRDYDYDERRYRSGSRGRDRDDRRSRSRYDEDDGSRRRGGGGGAEREAIELFPNGGTTDRRSGRRSRSRSPVELFPERVKNAQVELFPESGSAKNEGMELFPEKAKNASVELFPGNREASGRRRAGSTGDDAQPRTLFSIDDPIEIPRRGHSPSRQQQRRREHQPQQQQPKNTAAAVELFPEKVDKKRSLADRMADRIDRSRFGRGREENMDMDMGGDDPGSGLSIRGTAGGGLSIRGAAKGQAGHSNAGIELLPDKAANSLFNRISEPTTGRRGARRQKAEDMFG
ncbi:hypothetical protein TWF696_004343 [Orbilia brochopaga]|uniref:RRM domain-containing protein n=1 Tax=Orbilia brochopaga TaxID=3140254 RepID=A0AAV9V6J0_9PEZI